MRKGFLRIVAGFATALLTSQALVAGAAAAPPGPGAPFNDLGNVPWAVHAINALQSKGVLKGTAPGRFSPGASLTRAQMATALGRLKGWPKSSTMPAAPPFTDWKEIPSWARPYVAMAAQRKVLQGEPNGTFAPNAALTWDELAVVVARAFQYPPVAASQVPTLLSKLVNGKQTPSWAQQAVSEDVQAGDFAGILTQLYQPNQPVNRAELALFLDQAATGLKTATSLSMAPSPMAAAGSLAAGKSVTVTVYDHNAVGNPAPNAQVYLSFHRAAGGGSATVNGKALGAVPAPFTTGSAGTLAVKYTTPAKLPAAGTDTLTAGTANAGATASDSYNFAKAAPAPAIKTLSWKPSPVATPGSLAAGKAVTVAVYAKNASGDAAANAQVYLSFHPATGGGSATVDGKALSATPAAFKAGSTGALMVTYKTPAKLPTAGIDTLTAANAATGATATASDGYNFAKPTNSGGQVFAGETISLKESDGTIVTYPLAPNVTVIKDGKPATLSDLGPGESVTVTRNAQGLVTQIQIASK